MWLLIILVARKASFFLSYIVMKSDLGVDVDCVFLIPFLLMFSSFSLLVVILCLYRHLHTTIAPKFYVCTHQRKSNSKSEIMDKTKRNKTKSRQNKNSYCNEPAFFSGHGRYPPPPQCTHIHTCTHTHTHTYALMSQCII